MSDQLTLYVKLVIPLVRKSFFEQSTQIHHYSVYIPFLVHNISEEGQPVDIGIPHAYYVDTLKHYYDICK